VFVSKLGARGRLLAVSETFITNVGSYQSSRLIIPALFCYYLFSVKSLPLTLSLWQSDAHFSPTALSVSLEVCFVQRPRTSAYCKITILHFCRSYLHVPGTHLSYRPEWELFNIRQASKQWILSPFPRPSSKRSKSSLSTRQCIIHG
jgi:hypothetical protein